MAAEHVLDGTAMLGAALCALGGSAGGCLPPMMRPNAAMPAAPPQWSAFRAVADLGSGTAEQLPPPPPQPQQQQQKGVRARGKRKDTRATLADAYDGLYSRIPSIVTAESLSEEFGDKELRVIMRVNGMLINDIDPDSKRYVEKTKVQKIDALLHVIGTLMPPQAVRLRVDAQLRQRERRREPPKLQQVEPNHRQMWQSVQIPAAVVPSHTASVRVGHSDSCYQDLQVCKVSEPRTPPGAAEAEDIGQRFEDGMLPRCNSSESGSVSDLSGEESSLSGVEELLQSAAILSNSVLESMVDDLDAELGTEASWLTSDSSSSTASSHDMDDWIDDLDGWMPNYGKDEVERRTDLRGEETATLNQHSNRTIEAAEGFTQSASTDLAVDAAKAPMLVTELPRRSALAPDSTPPVELVSVEPPMLTRKRPGKRPMPMPAGLAPDSKKYQRILSNRQAARRSYERRQFRKVQLEEENAKLRAELCKTQTLAALVDHIDHNRPGTPLAPRHIQEILFRNKLIKEQKSVVNRHPNGDAYQTQEEDSRISNDSVADPSVMDDPQTHPCVMGEAVASDELSGQPDPDHFLLGYDSAMDTELHHLGNRSRYAWPNGWRQHFMQNGAIVGSVSAMSVMLGVAIETANIGSDVHAPPRRLQYVNFSVDDIIAEGMRCIPLGHATWDCRDNVGTAYFVPRLVLTMVSILAVVALRRREEQRLGSVVMEVIQVAFIYFVLMVFTLIPATEMVVNGQSLEDMLSTDMLPHLLPFPRMVGIGFMLYGLGTLATISFWCTDCEWVMPSLGRLVAPNGWKAHIGEWITVAVCALSFNFCLALCPFLTVQMKRVLGAPMV